MVDLEQIIAIVLGALGLGAGGGSIVAARAGGIGRWSREEVEAQIRARLEEEAAEAVRQSESVRCAVSEALSPNTTALQELTRALETIGSLSARIDSLTGELRELRSLVESLRSPHR